MKLIVIIVSLLIALSAAHAQSATQNATFNLSWVDNSSGQGQEDGFRIERGATTAGPFTQVGTVLTDVTKFADVIANDPGGVQQCYRVLAFNKAGVSAASNVACATSPTIQVPPNTPTGVTVNVTVSVTFP